MPAPTSNAIRRGQTKNVRASARRRFWLIIPPICVSLISTFLVAVADFVKRVLLVFIRIMRERLVCGKRSRNFRALCLRWIEIVCRRTWTYSDNRGDRDTVLMIRASYCEKVACNFITRKISTWIERQERKSHISAIKHGRIGQVYPGWHTLALKRRYKIYMQRDLCFISLFMSFESY